VKLEDLQEDFHKLGETDPLGTVLFLKPDRTPWEVEELFTTGENEIQELVDYLESLGLELPKGVALDFGCGIGRLTQPLARYFDMCYGVDIAPSMLELACKHNRYRDKCHYLLNETGDLGLFTDNSIDFILSRITLQNMAPRYSKQYIKEFIRILAPCGLLVFQIPSKPLKIRQVIKYWLPEPLLDLFYKMKYRERPHIEMHGVKREKVIKILEENGATIIDVKPDRGALNEWSSFSYCVTKE